MRATIGSRFPITKWDVPHYNREAPLGTSVFQLNREADFAYANQQLLDQKYADNLAQMKQKKSKQDKHPDLIEEPRPGANHVICAICREQFKDYLEHIFCSRHRQAVTQNHKAIYDQIDGLILELNATTRTIKLPQVQTEMLTGTTDDTSSGAERVDAILQKRRLNKAERKERSKAPLVELRDSSGFAK